MTDRDHFAAAALTGLLARPDVDADPLEHRFLCEDACRWADAMLRERGLTTPDAAPAARAGSDEDRTDKAATSHRRDRPGDTPVTEPMPSAATGRGSVTPGFDRSKPIASCDTPATQTTPGECSKPREGT